MARRTSVLLVEDDGETRERIADVIRSEPGLALTGAVDTCERARALLPLAVPDVLLTDLSLPDGNGVELIRFVRRTHPEVRVMVITVFGDEQSVLAAIEAGASGYLLKDGTSREIGRALILLAEGASPISPAIARHLLRRVQDAATSSHLPRSAASDAPRLSAREIEVLRLIARGFRVQEIATILGLSAHTITTHMRHLYKKLEVSSRSAAVYEAVSLGLLRIDE